jgi:hypothetical protein
MEIGLLVLCLFLPMLDGVYLYHGHDTPPLRVCHHLRRQNLQKVAVVAEKAKES